jgi:hypothetical protein
MKACITCGWAEWQLTPTGRIKKNVPGRCTFNITSQSLRAILPRCAVFDHPHKSAVWPEDEGFCPVWKESA